MTESEIHAVMTAGFACIAGSLFSAYIAFGVKNYYPGDFPTQIFLGMPYVSLIGDGDVGRRFSSCFQAHLSRNSRVKTEKRNHIQICATVTYSLFQRERK